jgi:hypothetical protein
MVARNFRSPNRRGEIDLIAWHNDILCFVEVKTRTTHDMKPAEAAVDREKRRDLLAVAREYLRHMPLPELRKDPIVGRWVIISTDRAKRPTDFAREAVKIKGGFCPFCYGNESKTPPEIQAYRPNPNGGPPPQRDSPGWTVRVVPNKFPALGIEGNLNRQAEGMFDRMNGIGAHEVIIETPDHNASLATFRLNGSKMCSGLSATAFSTSKKTAVSSTS